MTKYLLCSWLLRLKQSCVMVQVLDHLPDAMRIAVLGFAAAVACYDLARPGFPAALALPGESGFTNALVRLIRQRAHRHLASLGVCRQAAISAVQSMRLVFPFPTETSAPGGMLCRPLHHNQVGNIFISNTDAYGVVIVLILLQQERQDHCADCLCQCALGGALDPACGVCPAKAQATSLRTSPGAPALHRRSAGSRPAPGVGRQRS